MITTFHDELRPMQSLDSKRDGFCKTFPKSCLNQADIMATTLVSGSRNGSCTPSMELGGGGTYAGNLV